MRRAAMCFQRFNANPRATARTLAAVAAVARQAQRQSVANGQQIRACYWPVRAMVFVLHQRNRSKTGSFLCARRVFSP
jgi:hypothetical protein